MLNLIQNIKSNFATVGEQLGFNHVIFAIEETTAIHRLRDKDGNILLVAYPSYQRTGKDDNPSYRMAMAVWFIYKAKKTLRTDSEEDDAMNDILKKTEDFIALVETQKEMGCGFFADFDLSSIELTPCYSTHGGFQGWLMEFNM
ncbi:MAG: hypothetical protein LBS50_00385 [Prevotellaceae bacterium]|jgi:hypothetical protein|nr:hypothetical protein [Prevotellaceae bacterium]